MSVSVIQPSSHLDCAELRAYKLEHATHCTECASHSQPIESKGEVEVEVAEVRSETPVTKESEVEVAEVQPETSVTEVSKVEELPTDLPIAQLEVINFNRLQAGDEVESAKLFKACTGQGFFYLDLQDVDPVVLQAIEQVYQLDEDLYNLPDEEKLRFDVDKLSPLKLNGYKPVGRNFGGVGGKRDGFETYAMPKDGILALSEEAAAFERPAVVDQYMEVLKTFARAINSASTAIYTSLSKALDLPEDGTFEGFHRANVASPDIVRLLKYHAQPIEERGATHTPHTDLGSLTFLFTRQPGLQVLAPESKEWTWVQPKDKHAIVNLGDGMALLTNGFFHSCLHRVGPLPGRPSKTRYSFAYLMRAEDTTPMTGVKSALVPAADPNAPVYTSGEWIARKFNALRLGTHKKGDEVGILTGNKQV